MSSISIGMVNYQNALPYAWALESLQKEGLEFRLEKEVPSMTAHRFHEGKYDLCLLPCGSLDAKTPYLYQLPFGIVGDGVVSSVCLFSHQPLQEIRYIFTDKESNTSNLLAKILIQKILHQKISFVEESKKISQLSKDEALISIGDKALNERKEVKFVYDLAEMWKSYTHLPFVFAKWVTKKDNDSLHIIKQIEAKFALIISGLENELLQRTNIPTSTKEYLLRHIKYNITEDAQEGLRLFLNYRDELK